MVINGKEYKNIPVDFNTVCKLEDMGVNITDMDGKVMTVARAYGALCMRKTIEAAGREIEEHVKNGGSLNPIYEAFAAEVEKSGFFQALRVQSEEGLNRKAEEATEA